MAFSLNVDRRTSRVLSATLPEYAPSNYPQVDALPDGDLSDFLYRDGAFVYSPRSRPVTPAPENCEPGQVFSLNGTLYRALTAIAKDEPQTARNMEEVSVADILNALNAQKGETV